MDVTALSWGIVIGAVVLLLVIDFFTAVRNPHEVGFKEALAWSVFYIAAAVVFGAWVWFAFSPEYGTQYFAAYVVEKSLSVDNLFVFAIILAQFAVPAMYQQRVLMVGVILALVFRAIFIAIGAAALHTFAFTFVIFGAILIYTGFHLFKHWDEDPDPSQSVIVRSIRKVMPVTDAYHGTKTTIIENGRRVATPLLLVMLAVGATDLLFAIDSIPATFGVTAEPYLVFAANAFALLGLRALFFLLKGLLDKLVYLSIGLAVILMFIGAKLIATYIHDTWGWLPKIPIAVSLGVIVAILVIAGIASWIKVRKDPAAQAHAGRISGPALEEDH